MAYTIKRTNGNTITIEDNALNTTYGVQLIGKNRLGYGTSLNQNFFRLMENFSYSSAPSNPVSGQLWWDTAGFLKVYTGSVWKEVSSALISEPATPVNGDLWLDTVNAQLKAYNGTTGTWITVGPSNATTGILNGFVTESVAVGGTDYYIATMYANGQRIAILSKDTLTGTGITGFTNLNLGLNFSTVANCAIHNANVFTTSGTFSGNVSSGNLSTTGNLSVTGNANVVGNLNGSRGVFSSTMTSTSTTTGAVVITGGLGVSGNVNAAGNVSAGNLSATGATITGNISAGNLSVSGVTNLGAVGNVKISGGINADVLSTDGAGNLTWITPTAGTINTGTSGRLAYYTGATALSETSANLTWTAGTNTLSLTGNLQATNLTVTSNVTVSGNLIYADATNSRIGVGTTSPSYKTHIYQVDTAFSGNTASGGNINTNLYNQFLISPSSNPTVPLSYYGSWNESSYNSTANGTNVTIIGSLVRALGINSGNVATLIGLSEVSRVTNSGNVTNSYGINTALNLTSSGSVTTHYSLYIANPTKSSTGNLITNYGVYLESQTTGNTTNWGIYSAGGSNYFGGNILVGTTTPSANLTVNGTSNLGPIGNITITGGSSGQVLSTNGAGVLSWANIGSSNIVNGTSNVIVISNGNVTTSVGGTSNVLVVSSAGAVVTGTLNASGNANVGNLGTAGNITASYFFGNGSQLTGITVAAGSSIVNGTSNVVVSSNGNVTTSVGGTSNVLVVSAAGAVVTGTMSVSSNLSVGNINNVSGILSVTGNASVGNLSTTNANITSMTATGNVFLATSSGNVGIANSSPVHTLSVTGTLNASGNANVGNLGTAGNITASYFFGDGSQLTGITVAAGSSIVNGTSNVIVISNGNVATSVGGTSNVLVVSSAGAVVTGTFNATGNANVGNLGTAGNANVGNLGTAGNITASYFFGNGSQLTGITVAAGSSIVNGNSNVVVSSNGNVTTSVGGTSNVLVASSGGITVAGNAYLATSGNVGIGTTSPAYKLDVQSPSVRFYNSTVGSDSVLYLGNPDISNPGQGVTFTFHGSAGTPYASISALSQGVGWRNIVLAPNGGNVGIGNTAPAHTLSVTGTLNVSGNANVGNIGATRGVFTNIAGTLETASQTNITSVGTLTALTVSGNITGQSNVLVTSNITAGNINSVSGILSVTGNANVGNIGSLHSIHTGNGSFGNINSVSGILSVTGNANVGNIGSLHSIHTGNGSFGNINSVSGILSVTGNANVGNIGATRGVFTNIAGTLETASQTNITSVGTLGSLTVSGNTFLSTSSGNVGIGTTSPAGSLDVVRSSADTLIRAYTGNVDVRMTASHTFAVGFLGTFSNHDLLIVQNSLERMRFTSTGVNIGAVNPTNVNFAIYSTGTTYVPLTVQHTASTTNDAPVAMQLKRLSSGTPAAGMGCRLQFVLQDTGGSQIGTHEIVSAWSNAAAANRETSLRINYSKANSNYEAMRIDTNGNVGIGNTVPAHTLSVTGTLNVSGNANVGNIGVSAFSFGTVCANATGVLSSVQTLPIGISAVTSNTSLSAGYSYIVGANNITLTLPSSPAQGHKISFVPRPNINSYTIDRNGKNIMGLAENLSIDTVRPYALVYDDTTNGWLIAHA